ncbi:AAA family ATPase, partial [Nocardioides sp.]|uniref:ATP-binding protein n=1 Tax=Nocardioides sp. TaxID=35761 RepID=UPI0035622030
MRQQAGPGIIGRSGPQERLEQSRLASTMGSRSTVLVSGEAGIGKTSLIRATMDGAAELSTLVGWGTCWSGGGAPGFWPWMQALDDLAHAIGRDAAIAAAGDDRGRLAALIRELGPVSESTEDPDRQRFLLLDAAVRWLENISAHQHVAIVLDDLQWADASTLDLLDHLVAAPADARLLILAAYRHDELDHETRTRLTTLGSHTDHIHLEGLALEDVEELATSICGPELAKTLARDLHSRSGGHPLFVRELAKLSEAGSGGELPTAITGALTRRLEALPAQCRRILDAA